MFKRFFNAIASSIKNAFAAIKNAVASFFAFLAGKVKSLCVTVVWPPIKFVAKYIIYTPAKYLALAVYAAFYYVVYIPLKYLFIAIYKYFIKPIIIGLVFVGKKIGFACKTVYQYVIVPALRNIKAAFAAAGKFIFKYFIYPLFVAAKFVCNGFRRFFVCAAKFVYKHILCPVYRFFNAAIELLGKWAEAIGNGLAFLCRKIARFLKAVFVPIGKFFYNYLIYPLCLFFKYLFIGLKYAAIKVAKFVYNYILYPIGYAFYKLFYFLWFIAAKAAKFVYEHIILPVCRFFRFVFLKVYAWLRTAARAVWRAIKFACKKLAVFFRAFFRFLYQAALVVLFLPLIVLFYFLLTLITSPCFVFKTEIPALKQKETAKAKKVFLSPFLMLKNRHSTGRASIETVKAEKPDSQGLAQIKHYCGLITLFIWSVLLYPAELIIFCF